MITTKRLTLVPLTHEQIFLFKHDQVSLAKNLGVNYLEAQHDPAIALEIADAAEFWLKETKNHEKDFQWFTNWVIILNQEKIIIGGIGFTGLPVDGKTMVGYGLDVRHHNKGYATEALEAIVRWGFKHEELQCIVADTPADNIPSQKVLIRKGFIETGRTESLGLVHWHLPRALAEKALNTIVQ